jgi:hypothetical protein
MGRIREFELAGNLSREGIRFLNAFRHGEGVGGGLYWYGEGVAVCIGSMPGMQRMQVFLPRSRKRNAISTVI